MTTTRLKAVRCAQLSAVCLLLLTVGGELQGQDPDVRPDLGVRWYESSAVAPLELSGVVFDAATGEGVRFVVVSLRDMGYGSITDEKGRFSFRAPGEGEYDLVAQLLGYREMSRTVYVPGDRGVVLQIATEEQPLLECGLMICGYPGCESGVRVAVRALDTGLAPEGEIVLTVRSGSGVESVSGVAPARDAEYLRSHDPLPEHRAAFDSVVAM